jgi:hypothetical protein
MKPVLFLRIASMLTLIHAVAHTIGGVFGKPDPGPSTIAYAAMQANRFVVFGVERTYSQFYFGLGIGVSIALALETVVFWQLSSLAKQDARRLRPMLWTFLISFLALAVNSYLYFFLIPVIVETLIAACLGMAIFTAKPAAAASASVLDRARA